VEHVSNRHIFLWVILIGCPTFIRSEVPIVVITASYNNEQWVEQYFRSVIQQDYSNWSLLYTDDNSSDNTYQKINSFVKQSGLENRITLLKNKERKGHAYNQYHAIHQCDKNSIIVILDGDDWLAHENVFKTIDHYYQNPDIWLTYGQFWYLKKNKKGLCRPIPSDALERGTVRQLSWRTSHLRTFYAGLFQHIPYDDFFYDGNWIPKCFDVLTMMAMIELAGTRVQFIPDILYIYNDDNPISYHHDPTHQREIEAYIRTLPPYKSLKEKVW
jgi:glycosyltransferase involved in cell wall biosynthesis